MMKAAEGIREDIAAQRRFVRERSPAYARLFEVLDSMLDNGLAERLAEVWRGREFGAFYERPLLLANALRYEALRDGTAHPLWRGLARMPPDPAAITVAAVREAVAPERTGFWRALAERRLQTNETSRAVAWLWPARLAFEAGIARPLALFDVGASAGLNVVADHLPPLWEDEAGQPLDVALRVPIVERTGFDPRPVDVTRDEDALWLRACVWPGQPDREHRLVESIEVFRRLRAAPTPPSLVPASAGEIPELLPHGEDGRLALAYQTIMRDYVPAEEWDRYVYGMRRWLAERPVGSAVWVELEVTEEAKAGGLPAAITAHLRDGSGDGRASGSDGSWRAAPEDTGGRAEIDSVSPEDGASGTNGSPRTGDDVVSFVLAYCEPHPRALVIDHDAAQAFRKALGGRSG